MRISATLLTFLSLYVLSCPGIASARGDLSRQEPIEVHVQLGNSANELKFIPDSMTFETGKLYRLVLHNAGQVKHYFSSDKFVQSIYTRKVMTYTSGGEKVAEIKGHIREIEVFPAHTADWWFVPVQTGEFNDLKCTVDGHSEAGMTGTIIIR